MVGLIKKALKPTLMALVLVASIGFGFSANAHIASADQGNTDGRGTLTAEGDGIAILGGRGIVDITGNGILWIKDMQGGAIIRVTGYGEKTEFADGWIQYAGFNGTAHIEGTRIIVGLAGVDVELFAEGHGRVRLWGHGSYQINGLTDKWSTGFGKSIKLSAKDAS